MESVVAEQPTLFNINTKEIMPDWIDPNQPLKVPVNPLHFEAHKLQLLLQRLEKQSQTNPAQFNSTNYIATLDRFTKLCDAINKGKSLNEVLDSDRVAPDSTRSKAPALGNGTTASMDLGVSTDNPLAG